MAFKNMCLNEIWNKVFFLITFLIMHFNYVPKCIWMKLYKIINKTALYLAVEFDEKDIVKLLLSQNQIDINIEDV